MSRRFPRPSSSGLGRRPFTAVTGVRVPQGAPPRLVGPPRPPYDRQATLETQSMDGAVRQHAPILSVASFRAWLTSRPDEEHWELIGGVPMMMTPPNRRHQRIVSNLELLLNAALKRHNRALAAYHDIGVNIVSTDPCDPEPDVA